MDDLTNDDSAELFELLKVASTDRARQATKVACQLVVQENALNQPLVGKVIEALLQGMPVAEDDIKGLEDLCGYFDDVAFKILESLSSSDENLPEYTENFRRARAVSALIFTANERFSAYDAIYEALYATERHDVMLIALKNILLSPT